MCLQIYHQLIIPERDKETSITEEEGKYIYNFLKRKKIKSSLEIGFAYGCSAAYIISSKKPQHYAIDPLQKKIYNNLGLKNINKLNLRKFLILMKKPSYIALPALLKKKIKIDFAFIDGGHKFDDIFIDFFYVDKLLNRKGYILFHDSWMRPTQLVSSWIKRNMKNYKICYTPIKNLILFRKYGKDCRNWFHFNEFYSFKSFFSHYFFKCNF